MTRSILLLAVLLFGCGTTVSGSIPDAAADAAPDVAPDAPRVCVFGDGTTCAVGARCPAPDGCNSCVCDLESGLQCTLLACLDAGMTRDVPGPPPDRGGDVTVADVRDASTLCQRSADCPAGLRCVYTATGVCGESDEGTCRDTAGCESLPVAPQYCGCDGRTFTIPSACPPERPFLAEGPCPVRDAGTPDATASDGGARPYVSARMVWQSPGGIVGWGPAVMVRGDGTVLAWAMVREFDAVGAPPPDYTETRVTTAQVDDLFARWERVSRSGLPHGPMRSNECYPSVSVQRCPACAPERIRYSHPDQLTPEMTEVWAWFQAHTPGVNPAGFCR